MGSEDNMVAVPVTQADREAAAAIAELCQLGFSAHYIRQGKHDDRPLTQAFARHRLASTQPDAQQGESWSGNPHRLAAELRRVASAWGEGFRLPQLLRNAADEIDCLTTPSSPALDAATIERCAREAAALACEARAARTSRPGVERDERYQARLIRDGKADRTDGVQAARIALERFALPNAEKQI